MWDGVKRNQDAICIPRLHHHALVKHDQQMLVCVWRHSSLGKFPKRHNWHEPANHNRRLRMINLPITSLDAASEHLSLILWWSFGVTARKEYNIGRERKTWEFIKRNLPLKESLFAVLYFASISMKSQILAPYQLPLNLGCFQSTDIPNVCVLKSCWGRMEIKN